MTPIKTLAVAALAAFALPLVAAPAAAQPAAAAANDSAGASAFIDTTANKAFAVLRDKSVSKAAARVKFRGMLKDNVALEEIGNRLIRRQRATITPAQYAAYQAALPEFVLNAYTDRLYDYAYADVKMVRTLDRAPGVIDVYSRVNNKSTGNSFDAIWQVRKLASGQFKILNLTVEGINIALTQEADFSSYVAKNGFDKLVEFMKSANAKAAV